jgi:circadian clock protein KaiC
MPKNNRVSRSKTLKEAKPKAPVLKKAKTKAPALKKAKTKKQSKHVTPRKKPKAEKKPREYLKTGIPGLDKLFEIGIPKNTSVIIAGGAGSGKTLLGLQILANAARQGKKCLYMSFEEAEDRLKEHMEDFGWKPDELKKKGNFMIKKLSIYDISRSLDAMMAKSEGELMIDLKPIIIPSNFKPDLIVVDSLTAIASAFRGKESYRSYIESIFSYFGEIGLTSFLITETEEVPTAFSPTGVEEFLADGVIVLYNLRKGDVRENAIEIVKMRGAKHLKKVVAMQIVSGIGIEVYPEQQVFSEI